MIELPRDKFDVVLADFPWAYTGDQTKWAAAEKFYRTMDLETIKDFPVTRFMHQQSVLFLWATCPRLHDAIHAIDAWGLHYRGVAFVWSKQKSAPDIPIKAQGVRPSIVKPTTELVLAADTRGQGRPLPLADESICQVVLAPKRGHSEKPDEVQDRIELMYPDATKLELFARRRRIGWESWGDQIEPEVC